MTLKKSTNQILKEEVSIFLCDFIQNQRNIGFFIFNLRFFLFILKRSNCETVFRLLCQMVFHFTHFDRHVFSCYYAYFHFFLNFDLFLMFKGALSVIFLVFKMIILFLLTCDNNRFLLPQRLELLKPSYNFGIHILDVLVDVPVAEETLNFLHPVRRAWGDARLVDFLCLILIGSRMIIRSHTRRD